MLQGEPLEMQHGEIYYTANWTGGGKTTMLSYTKTYMFQFYTFTHAYKVHKTTYDPNPVAAPATVFTAKRTRVTTTEQTGLQELALDVEKMGVRGATTQRGRGKKME